MTNQVQRENLQETNSRVASEWDYPTIKEITQALQARKISASELVEHTIARIEMLDQRINAVVVHDFERARAAAKAADAALARGERRPLLGVPMTFKEAFNIAELPTTWGFPEFKDFVPEEDAVVVARIRREGAILIGKTNVPAGLGDFQSYNELYGTTNNPWDLSRSPGGSSGGSAAALAAGFGPLSFGSDIGGSLRMPAHFCGVYAHKPTLGLVPFRGYGPPQSQPLPHGSDIAVLGPMARCAADLALALAVIAGPDEETSGVGYRLSLPPPRHADLRDFRVLVIDTHPLVPTGSAVNGAIYRLAERLKKAYPDAFIILGGPQASAVDVPTMIRTLIPTMLSPRNNRPPWRRASDMRTQLPACWMLPRRFSSARTAPARSGARGSRLPHCVASRSACRRWVGPSTAQSSPRIPRDLRCP